MLFPEKKFLGLDISDTAIKAVVVSGSRQPKVEYSQIIKLPPAIVERGRLKQPAELISVFRQYFSGLKFEQAVFVLPEEQTFFHHFEIKSNQPIDIQASQQAKSNIPIESDNLSFVFTVEKEKQNALQPRFGLIIACQQRVILEWQNFFQKLGWLISFDTAPFALLRGIFFSNLILPICLVDIGAQTTNIIIFSSQGLIYEHTIRYASGQAFTQKIAQVLKISLTEAETLKKLTEITRYGKNEGAAFVLRVILESIAQEIKVALEYCHQQCGLKIRNIVLTGGSSQLKGLLKYYNSYFSVFISKPYRGEERIICQRGLPWSAELSAEYVLALGAASLRLKRKQVFAEPDLSLILPQVEKNKKTRFVFLRQKISSWAKDSFHYFKNQPQIKLVLFVFLAVSFALLFFVVVRDKFYFLFIDHKNKVKQTRVIDLPSQHQKPVTAKIGTPEDTESKKDNKVDKQPEKEWAVVKNLGNKHLNVRRQPSLSSAVIGYLSSGEKVEVLEKNKEWVKIKLADDRNGWVYKKFLNINK